MRATVGHAVRQRSLPAGLARETAGDNKGAIQIFQRIVRDSSSNRAFTAKALLQFAAGRIQVWTL
jgi:hypothetical protein